MTDPLHLVARHVVTLEDVMAVADGRAHEALKRHHQSSGALGPGYRWDASPKGVHVRRPIAGLVTWPQLAAFVATGTTPDLLAAAQDASAEWGAVCRSHPTNFAPGNHRAPAHPDIGAWDERREAAVDQGRAVARQVVETAIVAEAAAAPAVQLDLFAGVAS